MEREGKNILEGGNSTKMEREGLWGQVHWQSSGPAHIGRHVRLGLCDQAYLMGL